MSFMQSFITVYSFANTNMKMKNKNMVRVPIQITFVLILTFMGIGFFSVPSVLAERWINLDGTSEVRVDDADSLDGFSEATWNMWINQKEYVTNAGVVGKYRAVAEGRSYLLRTSLTDGNSISVHISSDGANVGTYTSLSFRKCGIRSNEEWTMITVSYDGNLIKYYRNGVLCDQDETALTSICNSFSPVRLGGGNNIFFNGGIDEFTFYNKSLSREQIGRLYDESVYGKELGQSIPVLVYHKIEDPASYAIVVSPEEFEAQMDYLNKNGFNTITLQDYNNWRDGTFIMPEKAVILVFDDGFSTVYEIAKPIMDQYGFVGSVATVTRYASFSSDSSGYMKWAQIEELSNSGWDIESHGLTHSHLLTLNESEFRNELSSSKEIIANMTGKVPSSFVFPFHESNGTYTDICGEYYDLCWTQGSLNPSYDFKSTPGNEYLSLRRINIVNFFTLEDFASFLGRDTDKFGEWNMEEGFGNTTADSSGNNNFGKLLNGASWSFGEDDIYQDSSSMVRGVVLEEAETYSVEGLEIDGSNIENVIDSDYGKAPMKLKKEKSWPDNMNIEGDYYAIHDPLKSEKDYKDKKEKKDKKDKKEKKGS
jgi:peptidoglycan/xylan/chitin deacetylase (PgdA/CDA1 family)